MSFTQQTRKTLMSWPLLVVLNVLVAITGYLKDLTVAAYLGTSPTGDAFTTAYFIVDLVGVLALGNAIGLASAAVFGPLVAYDAARLRRLVRRTALVVVGASIAVGLLLFGLRNVLLLPFTAHTQSHHSMALLYLVFLPTVVFYPIFYFFSGVLQAAGRYALSVGAPCLLNVIVMATGLLLIHQNTPINQGSLWLALSIPVSSALLALLVAGAWLGRGRRGREKKLHHRSAGKAPATDGRGDAPGAPLLASEAVQSGENGLQAGLTAQAEGTLQAGPTQPISLSAPTSQAPQTGPMLQTLVKKFFPIVIGYGVYLLLLQGLGLVERYLVSFSMPSGSLAAMTYASRLGQIPNWVFMSAVATWLIPHLARASQSAQYTEFTKMVRQGIALGIQVGVPMTIVFLVLRVPIVTVLFQRGQFNATSTRETAAFLAGYALAMTFQALSAFMFRVVSTTSTMRQPILYALIGVVVSGVAIRLLIPGLGALAIGLGEAIGSLVTTILLWKSLYNYTAQKINFPYKEGKTYALSNVAVIAMSILVRYVYQHVILGGPSIVGFVFVAASITGIFVVYAALTYREVFMRFGRRG